jgi:iron(III) transport system substrate-binding protein
MIRRLFLAAGLALLAAPAFAQAPSGALVLYTSQPQQDAQQTVDAFRRVHPGVQVDWTRDGTTQLMNRVRAEITAGQPRADVLLIADAMTMEALKRENRLLAYREARVDGMPESALDPDRMYFPTKIITTGIMVHRNAPFRPTRWADLLRPELRNQLIMPSPLYSGAATIHMGVVTRMPGLGWPYFETLARQGTQSARGNGAVLESVASGQRMYGIVVDFMAIRARERGSPVDFIFPEDGVTVVTEPAAILSTTRNAPAARAFIDFLLSREGQALAAQQGMMPARGDVEPPQGFPPLRSIRFLNADIPAILTADEEDKRRFADLFGR